MPGVLTDQDRRASPRRVERLHAPAGLDEPFLIEDSVGREEHLAVDVADAGVAISQSGVERGVVEPVLVQLVEAEGDVERRGLGIAVLAREILEQLLRRHGEIPHATLEEVAGERRFRRHDQVGRLRPPPRFPEVRSEPAEILLVGALVGPKLRNGKAKHGRNVDSCWRSPPIVVARE